MPRVVVCISGKRKTGKDYCAARLRRLLDERCLAGGDPGVSQVALVGVSHSLKEEYARLHGLDSEALKGDGPFKELHRKEMVVWGEGMRRQDPGYFCRAAIESTDDADVVVVSDCRRPTDLEFFAAHYNVITVRLECPVKVREMRGFKFVPGIDDAETECALDKWTDWDAVVKNDGDEEKLKEALETIAHRVMELLQ